MKRRGGQSDSGQTFKSFSVLASSHVFGGSQGCISETDVVCW